MFTTDKTWILPAAVLALTLTLGLSFGLAATSLAQDSDVQERLELARQALNEAKYKQAAKLYQQIYEADRASELAGDALYWQAFARYRLDKTSELKVAMELLQQQQQLYRTSRMADEGQDLAARIAGELAERGEAGYAREITEMAYEEQVRQETRLAALQSLMHMDSARAMPILRKIVQDDSETNRELRRHAVFILCHQGQEEAEDLIIELLKKETDPEFQAELVMCLAQTGSDRGLQVLMDLFRETKNPEVAEMALHSIGMRGGDEVFDFLVQLFRSGEADTDTRTQALMALSRTGQDERVADLLLEVLRTEKDAQVLEMAVMSLSHLRDERAAQAILEIVVNRDVDEEFRAMALHFAAQTEAVDLGLLQKLYDQAETRELKQQICHVLTMMDDEDAALDLLIRITRTETDPEIRRDAVFWIGQFDNDKAAEYLLQVIHDE